MEVPNKFRIEDRVAKVALVFSYVLLLLGGLFGFLQVLSRTPGMPKLQTAQLYYEGLTLHGVALAILWTAFFIVALAVFVITRELNINMNGPLLRAGCILAVVGSLMGAVAILSGQATVLYTFYPPLQASPLFFIALAIILIGTWFIGAAVLEAIWRWKKLNPGKEVPLATYGVFTTIAIWLLATPPLAYAVLFRSLPMSLFNAPVDVLEWRLWFWFFGHPLVYFWLVPAVTIWYTILPRVLGTEVFSKTAAKAAFMLYLIASVPVGLHHQFVDPGVHPVYKYLHTVLTYLVAVPSFITAFNVIATLEKAGRMRGGKGLFGWITALPWGKDPVFTGITFAIILFGIAGFSGVVNASFNVNYNVHNTAWVVGHFHLTVGGGVTLTFIATSFLLVPLLFGRDYVAKKLLIAVPTLWFVGQLIFGIGYHVAGLLHAPRRTFTAEAGYLNDPNLLNTLHLVGQWTPWLQLGAIGGVIFALGGALFLLLTFVSIFKGPPFRMDGAALQISPTPEKATFFDRLGLLVGIALVLIIIAYSLPAIEIYTRGLSPAPPYWPTGAAAG
ncbi:b(o/a)3-type cytochrome-c oxidase subunit 1 [Pyrobaculum aerophilum]|uniref:b(o/a)3-type cytochrome-c oxidase subunit 1 n=1 Tax=Pyrobaculum aerophilum TaxID=13773 RepID=UPI002FDB21EA